MGIRKTKLIVPLAQHAGLVLPCVTASGAIRAWYYLDPRWSLFSLFSFDLLTVSNFKSSNIQMTLKN